LDLAGAYSVLHHVPDYLKAVGDMARVVRTGGIIYIDHERNRSFWNPTPEYQEFQRLGRTRWLRLTGPEGWRKFLRPSNYLMKLRRLRDRRYTFEGDIHVWPDDHIEWDLVERQLKECGCKVLLKEEYLLYQRGYRLEVYQRFKDRCADMCLLVAGKR
jgi:SAM-dependent methyltransferase